MSEHEPATGDRIPPVLSYRHPGLRGPRAWNLTRPVYPVALAVACAAVGLAAPAMAGGHPVAWLASLGLTVATLWYITIRVLAEDDARPGLRGLALGAAGAAVLTTVLSALPAVSDTRDVVGYWQAYRQVHPRLYAPACAIAVFTLIKVAAWSTRARVPRAK